MRQSNPKLNPEWHLDMIKYFLGKALLPKIKQKNKQTQLQIQLQTQLQTQLGTHQTSVTTGFSEI